MNIKELIDELKELPPKTKVRVGVYWSNCLHIQYVKEINYFEDGEWVTIEGDKEGGF